MLATAGAAVGLGNIWRFPFMAGENGGGAFVLLYLAFVVVIGIPIAIAELLLGSRGRASPVGTMLKLSQAEGRSRGWTVIGWLSVGMPLAALSFYSVIASWSLEYLARAALGLFAGLEAESSRQEFAGFMASPLRMIAWHSLFIALTVLAVMRGVRHGLEAVARLMMPGLLLILLLMVIYGITAADFAGAVDFLFRPDFRRVTPAVVLMALGQAFFSLSVGGGYLITYGAYVPAGISLPRAGIQICLMDAGVALLAGLAIFPIVLGHGLPTDGGPGLIFESLPLAFGGMPLGRLLGAMFFLLLAFAAFTSTVSMLEPAVAWLTERRGWPRRRAAPAAAALSWSLGLVVVLSFNVWRDVRPLSGVPLLERLGIFPLLDFLIANLTLPLNALLIAIFTGWLMSRRSQQAALDLGGGWPYRLWLLATRVLAPVAILVILASTVRQTLDL